MATFHVIGKSLVNPEEIFNKKISGELSTLNSIKNLKSSKKTMAFSEGSIALNTLVDSQKAIRKDFKPIGIGKPLSIEIVTIYTGEYKKFLGKKDVIVVSGVKSNQTFDASSRAINIKAKNVNEKDYLIFDAFENGTKYVYYSPAMDADSTTVSFEMMFDNFDTGLFETISSLLSASAGIPLFLPAAPYLLGGSQLVSIGSRLGDTIFSGKPNLKGSILIEFNSPISPPTEPKEFIIYNENDKAEFVNLEMKLFNEKVPQLRLVNKIDSAEYKGYAPYMIVILNGAKKTELESFLPTMASSAILKKFYGSDNKSEVLDVLQDAMQLYNDSHYRLKGDKLKREMESVPVGSDEYKNLKSLYDAYSANIKNENFKLPSIPKKDNEAT